MYTYSKCYQKRSLEELEQIACDRFDELHGTDLKLRFQKLKEEVLETAEELQYYNPKEGGAHGDLIHEIHDLLIVAIHMNRAAGSNLRDAILDTLDKSIGRQEDKNYRR